MRRASSGLEAEDDEYLAADSTTKSLYVDLAAAAYPSPAVITWPWVRTVPSRR